MKHIFIILLLSLAFSDAFSQSLNEPKSPSEQWQETQTSFNQLLYGEINDLTCSSTLNLFIACIQALNKAMEINYPENIYMIELDKSSNPVMVSSLPGFVVRGYKKNDPKLKELEEQYYLQLKHDYKYWSDYKFVAKQFSFSSSLKIIKQKIKNLNDEAFIAARIYNAYLASAQDPHSVIMPKAVNQSRIKSSEELKIFGFTFKVKNISDREHYIIASVMKNSPASRSNQLEIGDIIIEVDDQQISRDVFNSISKKNSITLTVDGSKGKRIVSLERDLVVSENVTISVIKDSNSYYYGYIILKSFMDKEACKVIELASRNLIAKYRIKGTILDLRDNLGGLVQISNCLLNFYLEEKSYTFISKDLSLSGKESVSATTTTGSPLFHKMHNVVLINGHSASASEATSMYLQAYRKAFVVGEKSFGKGTMQITKPLPQNSRIDYIKTIARFYGPHFVSPQIQGVIPDFVIFPEVDQKIPTPFKREADRYKNLISNKLLKMPVMPARVKQIQDLNNCVVANNLVKNEYSLLDQFKKLVFDQQLSFAKSIIHCAINLELPVFQSTTISTSKNTDLFD